MVRITIPLYDDNELSGVASATAPLNDEIPYIDRERIAFELSDFVFKIASELIYSVSDSPRLKEFSDKEKVAFAFLQRATINHKCNHKLTREGICSERDGFQIPIRDGYKAIPLTRSVYEHLAMFYYLFEYPESQEESKLIWDSWYIGSKKNLLRGNDDMYKAEREKAQKEIEALKKSILSSELTKRCLNEGKAKKEHLLRGDIFSIRIQGDKDKCSYEKLTYDKAWKYLYNDNADLVLLYPYLSLHSHPTYNGLLGLYNQDRRDNEYSMYLSCNFLACLCRLFMKHMNIEEEVITKNFTQRQYGMYKFLSNNRTI